MDNQVLMFRAWDAKNQKMYLPDYPYIGGGSGAQDIAITLAGRPIFPNSYNLDMGGAGETPELIWMQYIGMQDKNGKHICDGDIGKIINDKGEEKIFIVKRGIHNRRMATLHDVDIPGFAFIVDGHPTFPISENYTGRHDLEIMEIVGNIYQNPIEFNVDEAE